MCDECVCVCERDVCVWLATCKKVTTLPIIHITAHLPIAQSDQLSFDPVPRSSQKLAPHSQYVLVF